MPIPWRFIRTAALLISLSCVLAGRNRRNEAPLTPDTASLDSLLHDHKFAELAVTLKSLTSLRPEQRDYFEGALALRRNRLEEAKQLLERAVNTRDPGLKGQERDTALTHQQTFDTLMMLGTVYSRAYRYGAAANMYNFIDKTFAAHMQDGGASIRRLRHLNVLLEDVPPQTISRADECRLVRNQEGYPIQIGDRNVRAIFDTGANVSQISASTAAAWGISPLPGTPLRVTGYGGRSYNAQVGVIPTLRIGTATLLNVVVVIAPDEEITIREIGAQLRPVLGYPVAAALGKLTFSKNGTLTLQSHASAAASPSPLWLGDECLLISLNTRQQGDAELFVLDNGSASTFLTDHYLEAHRSAFATAPTEVARLAGAGGTREIRAYVAHHLPLWFDATPIYLDGQHILTGPQGGEAENYYGVIGSDVLGMFSSYTIDLTRMEFSLSL